MRLLCFLLATASLPLSADIVSITLRERSLSSTTPVQSPPVTLEAGDVATVKYISPNAFIDIQSGTKLLRVDANNPEQAHLPVIAGPASFKLVHFDSLNGAILTYEIKRAGTPPARTPHNIVVIPDDNSGDYDVVLESSSDMVTWTPTQPGQFDAATTKRFFRVRLAKRP